MSQPTNEIIWLKDIGLAVENLAALTLVVVAGHIFMKYREYIIKKVPLTAFYILSVVALIGTVINTIYSCWVQVESKETKLTVYLFSQVASLSVQHCLMIILLEFYLQMRSLMDGKFLESNSVYSERSYSAELDQQSQQQAVNSKFVVVLLVILLIVNFAFFSVMVVLENVLTNFAVCVLVSQFVILGETILNVAIYAGMAWKLKRFLRENFNRRFDN
jgi:hypothetical protein